MNLDLNRWLVSASERLIRDFGLLRLAGGIGLAVGVLASLGLLIDPAVTASVVAAGFSLWMILVLLALMADRRGLYVRMREEAFILSRYADTLDELVNVESFDIVEWDETIYVDKSGNAEITRNLTLRVGDNGMPAFSTSLVVDPPPATHAYKRKIRIETGARLDDGSRGARLSHSYRWIGPHELKVYLHFVRPEESGSVFPAYVAVRWPAYFEALTNGTLVPNRYHFHRVIEKFALTVTLAQGLVGERRVVASTYAAGGGALSSEVNESGDTVVRYVRERPSAGIPIGFDLSLVARDAARTTRRTQSRRV
jgi:hypothetical protein